MASDGMRQTLYTLEAQEQGFAARMQDSHPRLKAVRQSVRELRQIFDTQPEDRIQTTQSVNPARQSLELSLLTERSHLESLAAADKTLDAQQEELRQQMMQLNAQALAMDELTQRVALAENNHKEYAQRLELARINRTLDDERISSLSLVQPASYVGASSGPRRSLVLATGLFVALGTAIFVIAAASWFNPRLCSAEQLVEVLRLPVVGVVPRRILAAA